jgi:hypothetical protein
MASRGCWTCKGVIILTYRRILSETSYLLLLIDRRIRCDRTSPNCFNCAQACRKYQGYGLRLSWPKNHNSKRALLINSPVPVGYESARLSADIRFVHTFPVDIQMHFYLLDLMSPASKFPTISQVQLDNWSHRSDSQRSKNTTCPNYPTHRSVVETFPTQCRGGRSDWVLWV